MSDAQAADHAALDRARCRRTPLLRVQQVQLVREGSVQGGGPRERRDDPPAARASGRVCDSKSGRPRDHQAAARSRS